MWLKDIDGTNYVNLDMVTMLTLGANSIAELSGYANGGPIEFGRLQGAAFKKLVEELQKGKGWVNIGGRNASATYYVDLNKCSRIEFIPNPQGEGGTVQLYIDGPEPAYKFTEPKALDAIRNAMF
jgi:hypothetical protein